MQVCFANPGTTEMWLVDGLNRADLRSVLCLHENVCTGAADGYARLARQPACTLLHLGPGLANGLANLHNAKRASSPIVNLVGVMATWHEAADPLLNMNVNALANSVSKNVKIAVATDQLPEDVRAACTATQVAQQAGGSRVSTLIIPHDLTWSAPAGILERNPAEAESFCSHKTITCSFACNTVVVCLCSQVSTISTSPCIQHNSAGSNQWYRCSSTKQQGYSAVHHLMCKGSQGLP